MFCPQCQSEYREGITRCGACAIDLVETLRTRENVMEFCGPARRVPAALIDWGIGMVPGVLALVLRVPYPEWAPFLTVVSAALYPAYLISSHAWWGQSVGKRIFGLGVGTADGGGVSWPRSIARFAPLSAWVFLMALWRAGAVSSIPISERAAMSFGEYGRAVSSNLSTTYRGVTVLEYLWLLIATIMMANDGKRRTIHDFVAGTVVYRVK